MDITFYGAAQHVTGSKHLLQTPKGHKILLDCGLFQGLGKETDPLNRHFGFSPSGIDAVFLSHAHIDHSGNLPRLVKEGFKGKIYCSDATADLCQVMLMDSAHIQESEIRFLNKRRARQGKALLEPMYSTEDVEQCLKLFQVVDMRTAVQVFDDTQLFFTDAGHILGSVVMRIECVNENQKISVLYTGDIGRYDDKILKAPEAFEPADYIICESTYGNRLHPVRPDAEKKLLDIILDTCVTRKGKVIIPAFSLGRTQELVYTLDRLMNEGKMPAIPVFVDSPLSSSATRIMRKHPEFFNQEIIDYMVSDPDPFGFPNLRYVQKADESKALNDLEEPCIIISASGMAEAGRIKHHLANNLHKPENTVLLVGYCTPESLGGRLQRGDKTVKIFGDDIHIKCRVEVITSYSAHADYSEMLLFLSCQPPATTKKLFLVHGETGVMLDWRKTLMDKGYEEVEIPVAGETFKLR
jgi:metallo-beta-lactamase family protein